MLNNIANECALKARLLGPVARLGLFGDGKTFTRALKPLAGGKTNLSYVVGNSLVVRQSGSGAKAFLDRSHEAYNAAIAAELGLNAAIHHSNLDEGLQISSFLKSATTLESQHLAKPGLLGCIASCLRQLHQHKTPFANNIDLFTRQDDLLQGLKAKGTQMPEDFDALSSTLVSIRTRLSSQTLELVTCHMDPTCSNVLYIAQETGNEAPFKIHLIDWEYSGNCSAYWDLAYFSLEAGLSETQDLDFLRAYFGMEPNDEILDNFHCHKILASYWICLWYWTQIANEERELPIEEYLAGAEISLEKLRLCLDSARMEGILAVGSNSTPKSR